MEKCLMCGKTVRTGLELCYYCFEDSKVSSHIFPDPIVSGEFMKKMRIGSY